MTTLTSGFAGLSPPESLAWLGRQTHQANGNNPRGPAAHPRPADPEALRCRAWEIGAARAAEVYEPACNHVGLAMVAPCQGFAHWRILPDWVEQTARQRGDVGHRGRLVLRLYDVSCLVFNGFNAHRMLDVPLPGLCGQQFFPLPRAGTWELAEVGFLLGKGEFVPAARSQVVPFARDTASAQDSRAALLVTAAGKREEIANLWDQEDVLRERRRPRLRTPLRIAAFAFAAQAAGHEGGLARFVSELAAGQAAQGHGVHVFVPRSDVFSADRRVAGVWYHPLEACLHGTPVDQARAFGHAAEKRLRDLPSFDLLHLHEWMTGWVSWHAARPPMLSLSSTEAARRNGAAPGELSRQIELAEREVVRRVACVLTPDWLRDRAVTDLGIEAARVRAFPMEGKVASAWDTPLDYGQVKLGIGIGPLDRLLLFVGPLEHAAGVDLLLEALPTLLKRAPRLRLAYVGSGNLYGPLQERIHQLGVAHAVRLLGHVEGAPLTRLLRAAEALVLPSRNRVPFDDTVVDLARRAGRPVVTTQGGPVHLVRHEENGIVTYDNPGSMVWAVDRILGDPAHAERLGRNGRPAETAHGVRWGDIARLYLELCAATFPDLTMIRG